MDNQVSVEWDTITGLFERTPVFHITLIDSDILDLWHTNPSVWEVERNWQHSRHVLAMVHHTVAVSNRGAPVMVYGVSYMHIPAHQSRTRLTDTLKYLRTATEDCMVLISTPVKPTFCPQPRAKKYYTLLPINGDPGAKQGPIDSFAPTTLLVASREGWPNGMATHVKLLPCFGLSKWPKTELIDGPVLARGPLWKNVHYVKHTLSRTGQPIGQELLMNLGSAGSRVKYTHTGTGCVPLLTVMACTPT